MKKILLAFALMLIHSSHADAITPIEMRCNLLSSIAGGVMKTRQEGMPFERALQLYSNDPDEKFRELIILTIVYAYQEPLYKSQENISEFKNKTYLRCMR